MESKVRVNAVLPGVVDTEILAGAPYELAVEFAKTLPSGQMAEPEDIAKSIIFLAREETGRFITGTKFDVMGGVSLVTP